MGFETKRQFYVLLPIVFSTPTIVYRVSPNADIQNEVALMGFETKRQFYVLLPIVFSTPTIVYRVSANSGSQHEVVNVGFETKRRLCLLQLPTFTRPCSNDECPTSKHPSFFAVNIK